MKYSKTSRKFVLAVRHPEALVSGADADRLRDLIYLMEQGNHRSLEEFVPDLRRLVANKAEEIAVELESLPIVTPEYMGSYTWMGFVLTSEGWLPCYALEVNSTNGWAMCGVRHADGATETLAAQPGTWADCTADDRPCLPWVWNNCHELPTTWNKGVA